MIFQGRPNQSPYREDEESLLPQSPSQNPADTASARWQTPIPAMSSIPLWIAQASRQCISILRPSFLGKRMALDPSEKTSSAKKNSTEYLDGVRGVASLIVFILHWTHIPYPSVNWGWGYKDNTSLWLLPFVRLIFSGAAMVSVFFVVSGFVLSHRFIQRMHRHEYLELYSGLTSLTFRRATRLFLPAFFSSFMAFICAYFGLIDIPKRVGGSRFQHGLAAYVDYLDMESNPWNWDFDVSGFYNPQLWSIAVEFRGSMVVFLLIVGLAKTRALVRIAVEALLTVHCFSHKRWDVALFTAGMLIAELQVLLDRPSTRPPRLIVRALLYCTLAVGVYLSGYPREHNTETPGYMWTAHIWPSGYYRRRFWLGISAILIVGPMAFLPLVQSLFLTRQARYLGRISYALYLVHGLGNRTVGKWLLHACWASIGKQGFWAYVTSFIVSTALYFPFIIWGSDIFWRAVDIPSTEFARRVERWCMNREVTK